MCHETQAKYNMKSNLNMYRETVYKLNIYHEPKLSAKC